MQKIQSEKHRTLTKNSHQLLITYHELSVLWILHHHNISSQTLHEQQCSIGITITIIMVLISVPMANTSRVTAGYAVSKTELQRTVGVGLGTNDIKILYYHMINVYQPRHIACRWAYIT